MHVAIVDDEETARAQLQACLAELSKQENLEIDVEEFGGGNALIGTFRSQFDIIFLDCEMSDLNGIETAKAIREIDQNVMIIFVTAMARYAVRGYEVEAFDFMVKPLNPFSFALKMKRAVNRLRSRSANSVLVRQDGDIYNLRVQDIRYLEASGHYTVFHTVSGEYREYCTFKEAMSRLHSGVFASCNRCYYVNLNYVSAIKKNMVCLGEEMLLISRPQRHAFLDAYASYLRGE